MSLEKAIHMWAYNEPQAAADALKAIDVSKETDTPWLDAVWWLPGWGVFVATHAPALISKTVPSGFEWLSEAKFLALVPNLAADLADGLYFLEDELPSGENIEISAGWFPPNLRSYVEQQLTATLTIDHYDQAEAFMAANGVTPTQEFHAEKLELQEDCD